MRIETSRMHQPKTKGSATCFVSDPSADLRRYSRCHIQFSVLSLCFSPDQSGSDNPHSSVMQVQPWSWRWNHSQVPISQSLGSRIDPVAQTTTQDQKGPPRSAGILHLRPRLDSPSYIACFLLISISQLIHSATPTPTAISIFVITLSESIRYRYTKNPIKLSRS